MASKLRHFVRLDANNQPVQGSNIKRPKKPKQGKFLEIFGINCCGRPLSYEPADVTSVTGVTFSFLCGDTTLLNFRLIGVVTNLTTVITLLNTKLPGFGSFEADGTSVLFKPNAGLLENMCSIESLSFTVEAV